MEVPSKAVTEVSVRSLTWLIPLTGKTPIRDTVRVVLDFEKERIEVE